MISTLSIKFFSVTPTDFGVYYMGDLPGDVSEEPVMWEERKKGWRMSCDVVKATEVLENEL